MKQEEKFESLLSDKITDDHNQNNEANDYTNKKSSIISSKES